MAIDPLSSALGAHGARLDQLDRDHSETRRRLDVIASTMAEGDRRLEHRMGTLDLRVSGLERQVAEGFSDLKAQLASYDPQSITLSIGRGRARWNALLLGGIVISIVLGVLDKMGMDTKPARDLLGVATAVGLPPRDIDGDDLRGTQP